MPAKILVVDDAPLNRRVLTSLLQPEGYVLLEAGNGREAVDLALCKLPVSKYFALFYFVLDCRYGRLRYISAARPPPLLRQRGEVVKLREGGAIIGLGGVVPCTEGAVQLYPDDRLVLYTDRALDCMNPHGEYFGDERFVNAVVAWHSAPIDTMCERPIQALFAHGGGVSPQDDISVLALEYQGGVAANGS